MGIVLGRYAIHNIQSTSTHETKKGYSSKENIRKRATTQTQPFMVASLSADTPETVLID